MINRTSAGQELARMSGADPLASLPSPAVADKVFNATGVAERARRVGEHAPDVTLQNAFGQPVRLVDAWRNGPLVIVFYRGGWCTYCSLQLRAWHLKLKELERLGATLVAISPQTPGNSLNTTGDNGLGFTVLSDSELLAADGFGIAFTLHPEVVEFYGAVGTDIPVLNGNGQWVLPVPATYVIDTTGCIRFALIETDLRKLAEPCEVIAAIADLQQSIGAVRSTR